MKLRIPFYKQENEFDCGPTALKMVLEFLGEKHSKTELMKLVNSDKSGTTWTIGIAKASVQLGFKTEYYTKKLGFNPENYKLDYYKKYADESSIVKQKINELIIDSLKVGVYIEEKTFSLNNILKKISEDCIAIVLLDWSKIRGSKEYIGHFVPIVGYDEKFVYVHNPGFHNPRAFIPIEKNLFDEARKNKGTDEDIIFISRKST